MPMQQTLGTFRAALVTGWIGLGAAGLLYARLKSIPLWAAGPLIAAFLLEYSFYLVPGFAEVRDRLRGKLDRWQLAGALTLASLAPYAVYSIPTGQFHWLACAGLAAIAAVLSFWYVALRPSPAADLLFLAMVAAMVLSRVFRQIYTTPIQAHLEILGQLMLIRTGALAALDFRRVQGTRFGFIPSQKEWITGVRYFFYFLPVGFPLALWLGVAKFNFTGFLFWKTLAIFCGALWVTALSEELFFRGMLQNWLTGWTGRPYAALIAASLVFGAVHLPFRAFPNWRLAAVAAVSACFYGLAYQKAESIRASMVTHALVVTVWRTMFV